MQVKQNFTVLSPDSKVTNGQGDTAPHSKKCYKQLCNVFTWERTAWMKHLFLNEVMFLFYLIFQLGLWRWKTVLPGLKSESTAYMGSESRITEEKSHELQ